MRLTQLKLAGFKSFVDPVSIQVPSQLVGIVGPNGCGKSNIIDAVRWVLGESRASELRGDSMQDVIFNGSSNRKPVARASVEMFFDNSAGRAQGQWSTYQELSVKRILSRDGLSEYLINGQKVRRKDITDLFLGTGLGPRAYAIIGQGMISRIIEARPEELRVFLEEAAGVTRYKERRKETEARLRDSRDNLQRVADILSELNERISHLTTQAETAKQYQQVQQALLHAKRLQSLYKQQESARQQTTVREQIQQLQSDLELQHSSLQELEIRLAARREAHFQTTEQVQQAQTQLYEANANVVRVESELRHRRDSLSQLAARQNQLQTEQQHWLARQEQAGVELQKWQHLQEVAETRLQNSEAQLNSEKEQAQPLEQRLHQCEQHSQTLSGQQQSRQQALQVERTHLTHARRSIDQLMLRRDKLVNDNAQHEVDADRQALEEQGEQLLNVREDLAAARLDLEDLQQDIDQQTLKLNDALAQFNEQHNQHTHQEAKLNALSQLQNKMSVQQNMEDWLIGQQLVEALPLWQQISIEARWETALTAVLQHRLFSRRWPHSASPDFAQARPTEAVCLLLDDETASSSSASSVSHNDSPPADSLLVQVVCGDEALRRQLAEWLQGFRIAESLAWAWAHRQQLAAGECWITVDGDRVSATTCELYAVTASGLMSREQEIAQLSEACQQGSIALEAARQLQLDLKQTLDSLNGDKQRQQQQCQSLEKEQHRLEMAMSTLTQKVQFAEKSAQMLREQQAQLAEELAEAKEQQESAVMLIAELESELAEISGETAEAQAALSSVLQEVRQHQAQIHVLEKTLQEQQFSLRECTQKIQSIIQSQQETAVQLQRIDKEHAECLEMSNSDLPEVLEEQLQELLSIRQNNEQELARVRQQSEELTQELRNLEGARQGNERALDPLRQQINDCQLKEQAATLAYSQYSEELADVDEATLAALHTELPTVKPQTLSGQINRLQKEMTDFGAVNLAAIEELSSAEERQSYLNRQAADISEAIETLENAIRRIDRETRQRLQETFNTVNEHFSKLFPQLFGGGHAELVMTGDEILDAGMQVFAQPPGKKNATIQLLSGGEKALTAIALVFSMFQLNPAPFCLLDEVDAPLDDSNTERFCQMVKMMSAGTQFLFISHNKIAMEMAEQLVGVTMQESGISRIVDVDMAAALKFAQV